MKRVLVTGGSRGLGLAVCRSLAGAGWQVLALARRPTAELGHAQAEHPGQILFSAIDLAQPDAAEQVRRAFRLDEGLAGFVANAAVGTEGTLTLTPRAEIERCLQVNLTSTILLAREAIKPMLRSGGSLVFISSAAAIRGFAGLSVYSATKGALLSFSRSLAREFGPRGIRSNCVLPGFLETEMSAGLPLPERKRIAKRTPLGRLGQPSDVAGTVTHLLSDDARFVTGAEIMVDGGLTA